MSINAVPSVFLQLQSNENICETELIHTQDGFWMIGKSLAEILARKGILDFLDADGTRLACDKFFDDWFLFAVPGEGDYVYSLLKLREQEYDANGDSPADGDTPGVTISFIEFLCEPLLSCLAVPTDANRQRLYCEIDRVVVRKGQRHHKYLKKYFINPKSEGTYLIADRYIGYIVSLSQNEFVNTSEHYKEIARKRTARLPRFIESLNRAAGCVVCDHEKIYIKSKESLTKYERAAILATHTGNTSERSFVAEVRLHARFLTPLARIRIPLLGRSAYDSAIRADMTIDDKELAVFTQIFQGKI